MERKLHWKRVSAVNFSAFSLKANPTLVDSLQVPKELYEFPDFRFTEGKPGIHASREQVQRYIEHVAEKCDLKSSIQFNSPVTKISKNKVTKLWEIQVNNDAPKQFDHLVVCTGMYSQTPVTPKFQGSKEFLEAGGKILHSSQLTDPSMVKDKRVVVIGKLFNAN
jgi:dimethylaniline monooxygenase (N-oxide forming)